MDRTSETQRKAENPGGGHGELGSRSSAQVMPQGQSRENAGLGVHHARFKVLVRTLRLMLWVLRSDCQRPFQIP